MRHVPPNNQMQTVDGRQNIQAQEQQQTRLEQQRCSRRQRNHISKFSDWKMLPVTLLKRCLHCSIDNFCYLRNPFPTPSASSLISLATIKIWMILEVLGKRSLNLLWQTAVVVTNNITLFEMTLLFTMFNFTQYRHRFSSKTISPRSMEFVLSALNLERTCNIRRYHQAFAISAKLSCRLKSSKRPMVCHGVCYSESKIKSTVCCVCSSGGSKSSGWNLLFTAVHV